MHHANPKSRRVRRFVDPSLDSVDFDPAAVGTDEPDEHLHEGRFARPVLPEDSMNPTTMQVKVDGVAGSHRAKALLNSAQADGGGRRQSADPRVNNGIAESGHPE
jgi:hypothetical protein